MKKCDERKNCIMKEREKKEKIRKISDNRNLQIIQKYRPDKGFRVVLTINMLQP